MKLFFKRDSLKNNNNISSMKLLVTGGAGYIGSQSVKALLEKGEKVAVIDNLFRGYQKPIESLQEKFGRPTG